MLELHEPSCQVLASPSPALGDPPSTSLSLPARQCWFPSAGRPCRKYPDHRSKTGVPELLQLDLMKREPRHDLRRWTWLLSTPFELSMGLDCETPPPSPQNLQRMGPKDLASRASPELCVTQRIRCAPREEPRNLYTPFLCQAAFQPTWSARCRQPIQ